MVDLAAYLLLASVWQPLGEDAGIGYGETGHDVGRTVWQTEIIGLSKQFILIVLGFLAKELVDSITPTVESLKVQSRSALGYKLQIV